jgi:hypothetical protein
MPKKSKSIKKTDIKGQKPWLKKSNISEYKVETESPNKTLLIICEGQTEKLYFESFPVLALKIKAIGLGQSKLKLVESAAEIQKKENCDEVWCVFDLDIKLDVENCIPDFDNAIKKAIELGFNVAYSNDAFELWFYLHYQYTEIENHRTFYYEKLSNLWNINYEKEGKVYKFSKDIYNRLQNDSKSDQSKAINRAKELYKEKKDLQYHKQNPVTLVYELVKVLNKNMRK